MWGGCGLGHLQWVWYFIEFHSIENRREVWDKSSFWTCYFTGVSGLWWVTIRHKWNWLHCHINIVTVHRVGRVLSCLSSRRNWDSPNPSPAGECASPLWFRGEEHTYRLATEGVGEPNSDEGTCTLCMVFYIYMYFVLQSQPQNDCWWFSWKIPLNESCGKHDVIKKDLFFNNAKVRHHKGSETKLQSLLEYYCFFAHTCLFGRFVGVVA